MHATVEPNHAVLRFIAGAVGQGGMERFFDSPETVKPSEFRSFDNQKNGLSVTLPERSVVVLELG